MGLAGVGGDPAYEFSNTQVGRITLVQWWRRDSLDHRDTPDFSCRMWAGSNLTPGSSTADGGSGDGDYPGSPR